MMELIYLKIRIHAVVTGDSQTGTTVPDTFTTDFQKKHIVDLVDEVNKIYKSIWVKFEFDPQKDTQEVRFTLLNRDNPGPDYDPLQTACARHSFAVQHPGKLVIYFRDARDGEGAFSGSGGDYVVMNKGAGLVAGRVLAHELGHYLGLPHTFGVVIALTEEEENKFKKDKLSLDDVVAILRQRQKEAIWKYLDEGHDIHEALQVFDGDAPLIQDTPPDDRGPLIYYLNNKNEGGPIDNVEINVNDWYTDTLKPDRSNIMSYFHKAINIPQGLSKGQGRRVFRVLLNGHRQHLIRGVKWAEPEIKLASSPVLSTWGPGHLDLFAFGDDYWVHSKSWDSSRGTWWPGNQSWHRINGAGWGRPAVVASVPGRVDLFIRWADGHIRGSYWTQSAGSWSPWKDLGGQTTAAPVALAQDPGKIDLFIRTEDGTVHNKVGNLQAESWWPGESDWNNLGGAGVGSPAAVSWGPGHVDVFARWNDGTVRSKAWDSAPGRWWPGRYDWFNLGGETIDIPAAVSWGPGHVDLFARWNDGTVRSKVWDQSTGTWWPGNTEWFNLGGDTAGPPVAVAWQPGHLDLFARWRDGSVRSKTWDQATGTWWPGNTEWFNLGGKIIGIPTVLAWGAGHLDLIARGKDGTVWSKVWNISNSTWWPGNTDWYNLGKP